MGTERRPTKAGTVCADVLYSAAICSRHRVAAPFNVLGILCCEYRQSERGEACRELHCWLEHISVSAAEYTVVSFPVNSLECRDNYYSATSNDMKFVHWPLMCGLLHLVQRGGDWAGPQFAQALPRCTKCNSPPINERPVYQSPLLCACNVTIKG